MTIRFAQKFTTTFISGGMGIKVQQDNNYLVLSDSGNSSSCNYNNIIDTNKTWTTDEWAGYDVVIDHSMERSITSNTADTLWITPNLDYICSSNEVFIVGNTWINNTGTLPCHIKIELFEWNTNYTTTIGGTPLVTDYAVTPSEEIENGEMWLYLFWEPLPIGSYLWAITIQNAGTGGFYVLYDADSTKFDSWYTGLSKAGDFVSSVYGLDSETYEKVMSIGDTFTGYNTSGGHAEIKINRNTIASPTYANSVQAQDTVTNGSKKIGRIASGSYIKTN